MVVYGTTHQLGACEMCVRVCACVSKCEIDCKHKLSPTYNNNNSSNKNTHDMHDVEVENTANGCNTYAQRRCVADRADQQVVRIEGHR